MALTNDDLLAISQLLDVKFKAELQPIKEDMIYVKGEISNLKEDVSALKEDMIYVKGEISDLKEDVSALKEDVSTLKEDMIYVKGEISDLKEDVSALKEDMIYVKGEISDLKEDVSSLKDEQMRINVIIEGEIRHDIQLLAENYMPAAIQYGKSSSQIELMQQDIILLKKVVSEHSEKLLQLA